MHHVRFHLRALGSRANVEPVRRGDALPERHEANAANDRRTGYAKECEQEELRAERDGREHGRPEGT
jgi:hypothetical protein